MLPRQPTGQSQISNWLRQLWDHLRGSEVLDSQDIRWHRSTHGISGTVIKMGGGVGGGGSQVQRFKVTSIASTWLVCRKVDSAGAETSSTDYKVMRPEMLRTNKGMLSGNTSTPALTAAQSRTYNITRSNPNGVGTTDYTITEILWPNYTAGDFIFGINPISGGTIDDGGGAQVEWIDLNIDARRWELELQPTEVCQNGSSTRKVVLPRSEAEI